MHAPAPALLDPLAEAQEILVFDSEAWGRVLVLDGVIQLTTSESWRPALILPPRAPSLPWTQGMSSPTMR